MNSLVKTYSWRITVKMTQRAGSWIDSQFTICADDFQDAMETIDAKMQGETPGGTYLLIGVVRVEEVWEIR